MSDHVSPTGGQRKNKGKLRLDLIPPSWIRALGNVLTKGALKYEDRNWEKGMEFSVVLASLKRHLLAIEENQWTDQETGQSHAALVATNALFLHEMMRRINTGTLPASLDNRPAWYTDAPVPPSPEWEREYKEGYTPNDHVREWESRRAQAQAGAAAAANPGWIQGMKDYDTGLAALNIPKPPSDVAPNPHTIPDRCRSFCDDCSNTDLCRFRNVCRMNRPVKFV